MQSFLEGGFGMDYQTKKRMEEIKRNSASPYQGKIKEV